MEKKVLLDAIYINNSGGKILLDYLITELEKSEKKVFYLLDKRVENNIPDINTEQNNVIFLEASLFKRHQFYTKYKNRFSSVLCFGNLPPNIRLRSTVYTYFHQQLYIDIPQQASLKLKLLFFLKRKMLKYLFKNTDYWFLQTGLIKTNFVNTFKMKQDKVMIMPFYPSCTASTVFLKQKSTYLYVSNAPNHKNHIKLINAFCSFYDQNKKGKLTITVGDEFKDLLNLITQKQSLKYPIENIGFVHREQLEKIYQESEFCIYPSLAESFGLGLIEAIENGCKIIGADLPYTFAVCEPSLTFDPLDEESISQALCLSLQNNIKPSISKVSNKIDELISLLK